MFFFTPIWGRFPFWLTFFRWVETTNQINIEILSRRPCNMNFSSGTLGKIILPPPPKVVRFSEPLRPQFRILNRTGHSLGVRQAWWWWWCFFSAALEKPKQHSWDPTGFRCFFWGLYTLICKSSFGGTWLHPWNLVIGLVFFLFWSWFHPQPGFQCFNGFTANSSEACVNTSQLVNSGSWSIAYHHPDFFVVRPTPFWPSIVIWYQISSVSLYISRKSSHKRSWEHLFPISLPTNNKNHLHE